MKSWRNCLLAIVVFLIVAYSAFWYYQADRVEKNLQKSLSELFGTGSISFQNISKGGFPSQIRLTLIKPKIETKNDSFGPLMVASQGNIECLYNLSGALVGVQKAGIDDIQMAVPDEKPQQWQLESSWRIDVGQDRINTHVSAIKLLQKMDDQFQRISQADELNVLVNRSSPTQERQVYNVDVAIKGLEHGAENLSPEWLTTLPLLVEFADKLNQLQGKQNIAFAMQFELPSNQVLNAIAASPLLLLTETFPTFSFSINKFSSSDNFYTSSGQLKIKIDEDPTKRVALEIAGQNQTEASPRLYEAYRTVCDEWVETNDLLKNHVAEVNALIPRWHELNPFQLSVDLSIAFNKETQNGQLLLKDFHLGCSRYGIDLKGEVNSNTKGSCTFTVNQYRRLLDTCQEAYNKAHTVYNVLRPDPKLYPLSNETKEKIDSFLKKIAGITTSQDDLPITITYDNDHVLIGNMTQEAFTTEITALWNEILKETAPSLVPEPPPQQQPQGANPS